MKRLPKSSAERNRNKDSSEMRLLRAVLRIAIVDYLYNGKGPNTISSSAPSDQKRAFKWLFIDPIAPNSPPFSFGWICQHLSDDHLNLAKRIRAALRVLKSQKKTLAALQNLSNQDQVKPEAA